MTTTTPIRSRPLAGALALLMVHSAVLCAQGPQIRHGAPVPLEVKSLYESGLEYLIQVQNDDGTWTGGSHGDGPGVDGLCCMAILASGHDPNFGRYAEPLRKGLRSIVRSQNASTGLIASDASHASMYHHGFATLALAEAYGAVDDTLLWPQETPARDRRSLGEALELAVRAILTAQNQNPHGGWRYTPDAEDADVSVSGANIIALLAARNAGLEVPDENIARAIDMLKKSTDANGTVAYQVGTSGSFGDDSLARSSIACLSLAIVKQKECEEFQATLRYLQARADRPVDNGWLEYTRYYIAQALFQGDFDTWQAWDRMNTEILQRQQQEDGSIGGNCYSTAMNLLSMGLNFRVLPIYER